VHSLLTLARNDSAGKGAHFLYSQVACNLSPAVIDRLAAELKIKTSHGRSCSAAGGMN